MSTLKGIVSIYSDRCAAAFFGEAVGKIAGLSHAHFFAFPRAH